MKGQTNLYSQIAFSPCRQRNCFVDESVAATSGAAHSMSKACEISYYFGNHGMSSYRNLRNDGVIEPLRAMTAGLLCAMTANDAEERFQSKIIFMKEH